MLRTDRGVFVVDLARQLTLASFGVSREDAVALAAAADVAIVLAGATLLVCTADGRMTRLPFAASPDARGYVSSSLLAVGERFFVVVVDEHLYAIDRSTVAFGAPGTEQRDGLTMVARADARSDDEVCVVRASLARFVALTHVRHQTHFNHPMDSPEIASTFVKGERVYVRGAALIRERELAASETALAEEHLEASALGALEPVAMPRADQSAERGESVSFARGLAAVAEAIVFDPRRCSTASRRATRTTRSCVRSPIGCCTSSRRVCVPTPASSWTRAPSSSPTRATATGTASTITHLRAAKVTAWSAISTRRTGSSGSRPRSTATSRARFVPPSRSATKSSRSPRAASCAC